MRRLFTATVAAGLMTILFAGTVLGAHCVNESKKAGAGQHSDVIIDAETGQATFTGTNAAGRVKGGFVDVWLDVNGDGAGDVQLIDDTFAISSHSGRLNPAQGEPGVLPPIGRGADPGGEGHGVGHAPE